MAEALQHNGGASDIPVSSDTLSGMKPAVPIENYPPKLIDASETASAAVEKTIMGLKGLPQIMVQLGFAGIMGAAFLWLLGHELPNERMIYRADLKEQREHDAKETQIMVQAVSSLGRAIETNQQSILSMQGNIRDMQMVIKDLANDIKRIRPLAHPSPRIDEHGLHFPLSVPEPKKPKG